MAKARPFTQETGDRICERLINGESLRKICLNEDMPSASLVCKWLADPENAAFREQYAHARDAQADTLADEILDIADDGSNDYMGEDEKYNGDAVQRSKLRVDARKWLASKLKPKKYGEAALMKLSGPNGDEPIQAAVVVAFCKTDAADPHRAS